MNSFSLYREAKDNYSKLIPDRKDGLIVLSLYSKYKDGNFSEDSFISIINQFYKDSGSDTDKNFFERNNNIILRLQESFLWRDKRTKTYHFKKYGLEFCQNIENRLQENYNPAKIKRWFDQLYSSLQHTINANEDFNNWISDHFNIRRPELLSQIEILDQQVNQSVLDFKSKIRSKADDILETLEQIELGLEVIKKQSSELKSAFSISYDIDEILTGMLENSQAIHQLEDIKKVQSFHNKSRNHLEQVSNRIERIKPQIREFIYNFNRGSFDRKTDEFIHFLLNKSLVQGAEKRIQFPSTIHRPILRRKSDELKLTIIPVKEFTPKLPTKLVKRSINVEGKKALLARTQSWKIEKDKVVYWSKMALLETENQRIFYFAPFFFKILKKDGFSVAVKTAHRILKETSNSSDKFKVTIQNDPFRPPFDTNITLWKMTIELK